jgi:hypothetical protein
MTKRQRQAFQALTGQWKRVESLGLPGSNIGWGLTLASLERRGLVESMYPSVESAGVAKVWRIAE